MGIARIGKKWPKKQQNQQEMVTWLPKSDWTKVEKRGRIPFCLPPMQHIAKSGKSHFYN